jgi:hypothetical protein
MNRAFSTTKAVLLSSVLVLAGCDFTVVNPGPVDDSFLENPAALEGLVNGAGRYVSFSISGDGGGLGYSSAWMAREIFPTGQTGSHAIALDQKRGFITPDNSQGEVQRAWAGRWMAEEAARRLRTSLADKFATSPLAAQALLWVGYSNRLVGEHMCRTVIDGGTIQPFTVHFDRAEAAFTEALTLARGLRNTTFENAALAGRASVRTWKGDWPGATADAALVPRAFKYQAIYPGIDRPQMNVFHYANSGPEGPFITYSVWRTFYADNFDQMKDPRTPYRIPPTSPLTPGTLGDLGDGRGPVGRVPYYQERKYTNFTDPIDLSTGHEAMLIVAEGKLRGGDWQGALNIVNDIRREVGVAARVATSADQTWTWLKLEKLIDFWMEGRAFGERRRWAGDGKDPAAPGALPATLSMDDRAGKDRCYPIPRSEHERNPNLEPLP